MEDQTKCNKINTHALMNTDGFKSLWKTNLIVHKG